MRALATVIVVALFLGVVVGCQAAVGSMVPDRVAVDAMQQAGFSDVTVVAKTSVFVEFLGCSSEDAVKFDMTATNPAGVRVSNAYVCAGWPFKGATIRYR